MPARAAIMRMHTSNSSRAVGRNDDSACIRVAHLAKCPRQLQQHQHDQDFARVGVVQPLVTLFFSTRSLATAISGWLNFGVCVAIALELRWSKLRPNEAMDGVRRADLSFHLQAAKEALGDNDRNLHKSLTWDMRRNPQGWSVKQIHAMRWLQHSTLKRAGEWRLKMALCAKEAQNNDGAQAKVDLSSWISWTRRSRLKPFKKLAENLHQRLDAVVRGMLDNRCNAYVDAMNGLLQQAMRAARGLRMASHFFAIAYLQMSKLKLKHLPSNPQLPATIQRADPSMQVNVKLHTNWHRAERK